MTEGQSREPRTQRARLGAELRRARTLAGLSGRQVADATGLSQPTVSRIERGESVPSLREVIAWADAVEVGADRKALILGLAEAAVNEVTTFRARLSNGLAAVQEDVRGLEATARTLRNFQPGIIPGLLQTAEYARRILAFADETANVGAAVAARLTRQEILHEPGRSFEFLLTEAALRYRPGPREVLTAQLDHLAAVVTLEAISFGVIPADAEMTRHHPVRVHPLRRPARRAAAFRYRGDSARLPVCERPRRRRALPGPAGRLPPVGRLRRRGARGRAPHRPPARLIARAPAGMKLSSSSRYRQKLGRTAAAGEWPAGWPLIADGVLTNAEK